MTMMMKAPITHPIDTTATFLEFLLRSESVENDCFDSVGRVWFDIGNVMVVF